METSMTLTKVFSIKPGRDSEDSKHWTLELTIPKGTTERDLAQAVLASEVIKVQNGNRSKYDKFPNGHVFKKTFAVPGIQVDHKQALIAEARGAGIDIREIEVRDCFQLSKAKLAALIIGSIVSFHSNCISVGEIL